MVVYISRLPSSNTNAISLNLRLTHFKTIETEVVQADGGVWRRFGDRKDGARLFLGKVIPIIYFLVNNL